MRISSIPPKDLYYQYIHIRDRLQTPSAVVSGTDKVELTSGAKTFSQALLAAKELISGADKSSRAEELKQQIANGAYSVPGYKVAEKILGE